MIPIMIIISSRSSSSSSSSICDVCVSALCYYLRDCIIRQTLVSVRLKKEGLPDVILHKSVGIIICFIVLCATSYYVLYCVIRQTLASARLKVTGLARD